MLVRDGEIIAVGQGLVANGAETIPAAGMVLIPGFVDTHWHLWNTLMRGLVTEGPGRLYAGEAGPGATLPSIDFF